MALIRGGYLCILLY